MSEDFDMWTDFSGEPFNSLRKQVEDLETDQMKLNFLTDNVERLKKTISLDGVYPLDIEMAIRWAEDKIKCLKYQLEPKKLSQENPKVETEQSKEISQNSNNDLKSVSVKKQTYKPNYSPSIRKQIIEAAVKLSERKFEWNESDLIDQLNVSKSTLDRQKRHFKLKIRQIRNEAREIIRKNESK
ncbi:MAG: hypothetical protein AAB336_07540 [Acidobacteriota bacterium]